MQPMYVNFGGHDHSGPFCVHALRSAGEVRDVLQGYLLNKPFANVEALAAIGEAQDDDMKLQARVFVREGQVEGGLIAARGATFLTHMKPDVTAQVLTYLDERGLSALAGLDGPMRAQLALNAEFTSPVREAWQKSAERVADVSSQQDYFLYSDILSPPALPTSKFDALVRRATKQDQVGIIQKAVQIDPKELAAESAERIQQAVRNMGYSSPYIIESNGVIRSGVYNLAPISQSGALLTQMDIAIQPWAQPVQYGMAKLGGYFGRNKPQEQAAESTLIEPATLNVLLPELTRHFAALARTMQQQGRWLMIRTSAANNKDLREAMPIRSIAKQLGFMEAGGLDLVTLHDKSRPEAEIPPFRFMRLGS